MLLKFEFLLNFVLKTNHQLLSKIQVLCFLAFLRGRLISSDKPTDKYTNVEDLFVR